MRSTQRGQTVPIWIGGILATLTLVVLILSYGQYIGLQIRAQNAADSAASAIVSVQAQQWNQMNEMLYAAGVEEFRLRSLLEMVRLSAQNAGGCTAGGGSTSPSSDACSAVYYRTRKAYLQSAYRYQQDVDLLSRITTTTNFRNEYSDGVVLMKELKQECDAGRSQYLDCEFGYDIVGLTARNAVNTANQFPQYMQLPNFNNQQTSYTNANMDNYGPLAVEVAACRTAKPLIGNVWPFTKLPNLTVVARGAATDAMVVQDWLQPGAVTNPSTGRLYQPDEVYGPSQADGTENWFTVHYGGNAKLANAATSSLTAVITQNEFSANVGWWGAVPIHPFMGPKSVQELFPGNACP